MDVAVNRPASLGVRVHPKNPFDVAVNLKNTLGIAVDPKEPVGVAVSLKNTEETCVHCSRPETPISPWAL